MSVYQWLSCWLSALCNLLFASPSTHSRETVATTVLHCALRLWHRHVVLAATRLLAHNAIYFQVYGIFSSKRHKICARELNFLGAANFVQRLAEHQRYRKQFRSSVRVRFDQRSIATQTDRSLFATTQPCHSLQHAHDAYDFNHAAPRWWQDVAVHCS